MVSTGVGGRARLDVIMYATKRSIDVDQDNEVKWQLKPVEVVSHQVWSPVYRAILTYEDHHGVIYEDHHV